MTFYEGVTLMLSFGALVAVAYSVWMLRRQLKIMSDQSVHLEHTLKTSAESGLDVLFTHVTQAYLDYPELRPIFNEGEAIGPATPIDSITSHRANALAEALADSVDRALSFRTSGVADEPWDSLQAWTKDSLRHSTFFRSWLTEHQDWYSSDLREILTSVEGELAPSEASAAPAS